MKDEIFYGTNILIYAYDETEPEKRCVCKNLVEEMLKGKKKWCCFKSSLR
jgi:predicted nucleic acid-binding protein